VHGDNPPDGVRVDLGPMALPRAGRVFHPGLLVHDRERAISSKSLQTRAVIQSELDAFVVHECMAIETRQRVGLSVPRYSPPDLIRKRQSAYLTKSFCHGLLSATVVVK